MSSKSHSDNEAKNQIEQKKIEIELHQAEDFSLEQIEKQIETEAKEKAEHIVEQIVQEEHVVKQEIVKDIKQIVQHVDQAGDFSHEIKEEAKVVKEKRQANLVQIETTQDNMRSDLTEYLLSEQPQSGLGIEKESTLSLQKEKKNFLMLPNQKKSGKPQEVEMQRATRLKSMKLEDRELKDKLMITEKKYLIPVEHYKKVNHDPKYAHPIDKELRLNKRQIQFWKKRRWHEIDEVKELEKTYEEKNFFLVDSLYLGDKEDNKAKIRAYYNKLEEKMKDRKKQYITKRKKIEDKLSKLKGYGTMASMAIG